MIGWVSTCSDPGTTATCTTTDAVGGTAGLNQGEPYKGVDVGATFAIMSYTSVLIMVLGFLSQPAQAQRLTPSHSQRPVLAARLHDNRQHPLFSLPARHAGH